MSFRKLLIIAVAMALYLPAVVYAQPEVLLAQDSCVTVDETHVRVYFTLTNHSTNYEKICSFQFIPIPSPASPECTVTGFGGEDLWVGSTNLNGGVWFGVPPTEYSFACTTPNSSQGGFYITIDPSGDCCYEATFTDDMYQTWWSMTWCVGACNPVPIEHRSWGHIKSLYN